MALYEIPVRNDILNYTLEVELDDETYTLIFEYNQRDSCWYMGIQDYLEGQKLVSGAYNFVRNKHLVGSPQGNFVIYDTTGNKNEPTLENFGDTVKLFYNEAA
jgi:hypothetical protein